MIFFLGIFCLFIFIYFLTMLPASDFVFSRLDHSSIHRSHESRILSNHAFATTLLFLPLIVGQQVPSHISPLLHLHVHRQLRFDFFFFKQCCQLQLSFFLGLTTALRPIVLSTGFLSNHALSTTFFFLPSIVEQPSSFP